ncbi:hypothetical protein V5799_030817 [Amblyomma americanum]|uniref:Uncharacterized protein n=1 Tax=Amblyomma americanum TaxID=6943 RepID=A0AAQ4EMA6_AMBAM
MLIFNSNTTHPLLRASLGCSVAAGPSETSSSVLGGPPPALRICRLVTAVGSQSSRGAVQHEAVEMRERTDFSSQEAEEMEKTEVQGEYDFYPDNVHKNNEGQMSSDDGYSLLDQDDSSSPSAAATEDEDEGSATNETEAQRPRKHPMKFIVETCFVLDREYESAFKTIEEVVLYLAAMLNASDMIINRTSDGVDVEATLDNMKELALQGAFNHCDITVFLTRLGASHDNTSALDKFPGYPGSENCSSEDGYLMSYQDGGRKKYRLSNCSKDQIRFIYR